MADCNIQGGAALPVHTCGFHPIANLFPLMEDEELDALAENIRANGLCEPIILYNGQVLDGRNRKLACERAGVVPHYVHFEGNDALAYVLSKNLIRRHLNDSQRGLIAAKVATLTRGQPGNASNEAITQPGAAALLNISRSTVQRAAVVRDRAVPELVGRVERGDISVALAAKLASNLSEEQQRQLANKPEVLSYVVPLNVKLEPSARRRSHPQRRKPQWHSAGRATM